MAEAAPPEIDSVVGQLVVERGLATADEVERARRELGEASGGSDPSGRSLAQVLVESGVVTRGQIERLRPEMEASKASQQIPGYQILGKLGAGAMATVYKARQLSLDREVAIKVLPQKHTKDPDFVARFYAEGKAAGKLNHPNIVAAYDVGQAGEFHYFVMEYVEGRSVWDDLQKRGRYPEQDALNLVLQVARALEHAHAAGFVHRDVKPKNIMITNDGVAKLADMGLARAVSDREAAEAEAGKAYGTPYYISPEQIRGEVDIDFRADIYSLGATAYHMVTGRVPFDGPNPSAVMHKHLKEELVPPDHRVPELTSGFSEVIEVCMAKKARKRYASTTDLLQDLEAIKRGEPPIQARKAFELADLAALGAEKAPDEPDTVDTLPGPTSLRENPLFLHALSGWAIAALLLIALIIALVI